MASLRRRVYEVLEGPGHGDRTATIVHRALVALIVVNVATVVLETVPAFHDGAHPLFVAIEIVSLAVFATEYGLRVWAAPEHPRYRHLSPGAARIAAARTPAMIVDLLAVLPFLVALFFPADLRAFLLLRVLRYFKLMRYSPGLASLGGAIWTERRALAACLVILCAAVLISASLMYAVERLAQPERFGTIPDAMYWAFITLTTVGYGDIVPVTPLGKIVAILTAVAGLVMLALPVGIIASAFAREIHRRDFVVTWGLVSRVPLFSGLEPSAVGDVMRMLHAHSVDPGEIVCRKGEPAHSMFIIASGEVEVELPDRMVSLGPGHFFGEMAVMRRSVRSATIRATERSRLLALDADDMHALMRRHPEVAALIERTIDTRLGRERLEAGGDLVTEEVGVDRPAGPSTARADAPSASP
jgi:voltage-gated potassium channel